MIFITGGTGLLGARVIYDLLISGHKVRALRRIDSDLESLYSVLTFYHGSSVEELTHSLEWVEGDVLDYQSILDAFDGVVACIHSAAMVSFHSRDHLPMYRLNVHGTSNIVNVCLERNVRLIHISSIVALGRSEGVHLIDEGLQWKDSPYNSQYGLSKYRSELEVWRGIEEGLDAVILNPSIIIGAGSPDKSSGSIFGVVVKGLRFYPNGSANVVDVRDVSTVILQLLSDTISKERFILNSASVSFKDLFTKVSVELGKEAPRWKVSKPMLQIGWRLLALKDFLFRTKSTFTRENAISAEAEFKYDNTKARKTFQIEFRDWQESVIDIAPYFSTLS